MATEKPANEDLSQQVSVPINNAQLEEIYEANMDAMFTLAGRLVTLWLPPAQTPTTSNPAHHNPWFNTQDPRFSDSPENEGGRTVEPIYVRYTAHVVHGPSPIADGRPFELETGDVQLTTVIGSKQDIEDAIELEIDGNRYDRKKTDDRQIGWSTPKYMISIWSKKAEA